VFSKKSKHTEKEANQKTNKNHSNKIWRGAVSKRKVKTET